VHLSENLLLSGEDMGKKDANPPAAKKKGGCFKYFFLLFLLLIMGYSAVHVLFLWLPAGKPDPMTRPILDANVAGFKVFPAIRAYPLTHLASYSNSHFSSPSASLK